MHSTVADMRAVITRAERNLLDFQNACKVFRDHHPYKLRPKEDADTGQRCYYVVEFDPVPRYIATIAADVLNNLRSSLNYIVADLMRTDCGTPDDETWDFPIGRDENHYKSLRGQIKCIREGALKAIDAIEPYGTGNGRALFHLIELQNACKHRRLVQTAPYFAIDVFHLFRMAFRDEPETLKRFAGMPPAYITEARESDGAYIPLKVGDKLWCEPVDFEVQENPPIMFDIAFDEPGVMKCEPALKTLTDLTHFVRDISAKFEVFFT